MASYRVDTFYSVMVAVSFNSRFTKDASYTCMVSGMGRCNHVAAVLYALLDYIQTFGIENETCTSQTCKWNMGRKKISIKNLLNSL